MSKLLENAFKDKTKCCFLFFLSSDLSAIISTLFMIVKKKELFNQITVSFAVYILFCIACFICNFTMIAFSKFLRYDYNVYNRYAINYYYDHYNDEEIDFDGVRHAFKVKLITLTFVHLFLIVIMIYYYSVICNYVEEMENKKNEYNQEYIEKIKRSTNNTYNINSMKLKN
ncbi:hypothetical protein LY90DRAFT_514547 [Neocallimastix californiae]|uniref:Uncharacterized protein n=1 Tax=Neocallimastix californiae TaxID=1754190 RepID=A0A1Y2APT5_9FUNG|nr:hypothetical protein LY90DRAFT_514547 [Neocallimastix californiae]|eukprot:ORY24506.1 hypothetical protein LY90DRAFT_514547 [Neocallimastix californiae]